ncbi:MAG: Mur ligase domain-containing protein, partial [Treponema sp.]|nr:Mur ligase domain-containing protein [Treponema sp.]
MKHAHAASAAKHLSDFFTKEISEKSAFLTMEGNTNPLVTGIQYDSKKIKQGNLFFALPENNTEGNIDIDDALHSEVSRAIDNGAEVIVHDNDQIIKKNGVVYLKVKNA